MSTRRDFIKRGASAAALAMVGQACAASARRGAVPSRSLRILVLGGTGFIGPYLVRHAVARGHAVSIFTRGRHDADLPDSVEHLVGDRNNDLKSLEGKRWDVVIDDSANNPDWVDRSAQLLKNATGAYLFVSSTGVYYPYLRRGLSEADPVHYDVADSKDPSETFGVAKARGERIAQTVFGDRAIIVRPTYIVGPNDPSDRFPYWPVRLKRGGEVLAPGKPDDPMQIVDVRDLAEFMVKLVEDGGRGVYNAAGPAHAMTAAEFYPAAAKALNADVRYTYVDDYDFLVAHKIEESIPWALLRGNDYGMMSIRNDRAIAAGLRFRPLAETLRDTLAWYETAPAARRAKPRFEITPEIEAAALADWHARHRS